VGHCPPSRSVFLTEPLDVPSRPWSLSLPASLPETSSPFSSRAREPHEVSRTRTPSADETPKGASTRATARQMTNALRDESLTHR
jgi:hypothetical protein